MNHFFSGSLGCFFSLLLLCSCHPEYSNEIKTTLEAVSTGTLNKDNAGNCLPITVVGTYLAGIPLADSDYLQLDVRINHPGKYLITTDTVNGYWFSASGNLTHTGSVSLRLIAQGIPLSPGTNTFNIFFDSSICQAFVPVGIYVIPPAVYTVQGAPGSCTNPVLAGNYLKGMPLDSSNQVILLVNVSVPGKYTLSTNSSDGFGFSAAGQFFNKGLQMMVLYAKGTPAAAGSYVFTLRGNASACSFTVAVTGP